MSSLCRFRKAVEIACECGSARGVQDEKRKVKCMQCGKTVLGDRRNG